MEKPTHESRWSLIAGRLPGRTDNEIKHYWNTNLAKKLKLGPHQYQSVSVEPIINHENNTQKNIRKLTSSQSHVVRTKATKCSKVLLLNPPLPQHQPQPQSPLTQFHNNSNYKQEAEAENLLVGAVANNSISNQTEPSDGIKEISTDFLFDDFEIREVCLSDFLNSDFSDMCDFDEILKDWTQSDFADIETTRVPNNNIIQSDFTQKSLGE